MLFFIKSYFLYIFIFSGFFLVSCGKNINVEQLSEEERIYMPRDRIRLSKTKAGRGLLSDLFKSKSSEDEDSNKLSRVNNYLWQASLDVLSNFPLSSVDSSSGLIITDWYSSEKEPQNRFKITVLIMSNEISANAVKVKIHKQAIKNSRWINQNIEDTKTLAIERKIIQKAVNLQAKSS